MRVPVPAGMLLDHPAVPVPAIDRQCAHPSEVGDSIAGAALSRREKASIALQLTAAASLMAEFDLWPGQAAIRHARVVRHPSGVRAILAAYPVPMSRVFSRLGGWEAAAATTRNAVLASIA